MIKESIEQHSVKTEYFDEGQEGKAQTGHHTCSKG